MRRWVVGMCMVTVAILATTALATGSRQDDGFSTDRMAFVEEMRLIFMQSADVKRGESAVAELQQLVNSGDDRMVNLLIEICNNIKKRKGKAFPDYITAIKTIGVMNQSQRISGQNFDVWEKVLEKKSKKLSYKDKRIRKKYNINIMAVKQNGVMNVSVSSDTLLSADKTMLVLGEYKALQKCFKI